MSFDDYEGVGTKTAQNLEDAGYTEAMQLARKKPENLSDETGIGEGRCESIIKQARDKVRSGSAFSDGKQQREMQRDRLRITTGSDAVDKLLGGGIPGDYITELYGKNSSGKTQMSLQLTVNAQLPEEEGGADAGAIFIDTEDTFSPDRVEQMAEAQGLDPEEVLENIYVSKPFDSDDQLDVTMDANELCAQKDIGIVVVDSIIAHLRTEYNSGRGELTERGEIMGNIIDELKDIASTHNVPVVMTNQVYDDPGEMFGDPTTPVGGNIVSHAATFIVYLQQRSAKKEKWAANLKDSPNMPDDVALFTINDKGIRDFE